MLDLTHMVLGGLFGRQPDARHLGGSVSASSLACRVLSRRPSAFWPPSSALAMVRPNPGSQSAASRGNMVEIDETSMGWSGPRTTSPAKAPGEVHHKVLVACAVEVRHRKPGDRAGQAERTDAMPGVSALAVVPDAGSRRLALWVRGDRAVAPRTAKTVTDDWSRICRRPRQARV